jgi:hypothetical protein
VRESLDAQVVIWVNIVLNHIDTMAIFVRMKVRAGHRPK